MGKNFVKCVIRARLFLFFPLLPAFKGKWWLCFVKFFKTDKAVGERLCEEGKWSGSGSDDGGGRGRRRKVTAGMLNSS